MAKDYYKILGVNREASEAEIKKAYRKLAHQHHPDKGGGDEAKFKEINEAYQILGNKEKRDQYDRFGQAFSGGQGSSGFEGFSARGGPASGWDFGGFSGSGGSASGFDFGESGFEDLFSEVFGGTARGSRRTSARSGGDIAVDLEITFEEAARGVEKDIPLRKHAVCEICRGSGGKPGSQEKSCPICQGAGQIRRNVRSFLGVFTQIEACTECHGKGKVFAEKCSECHGAGRIKKDQTVHLKIPAGIQNGQTIALSGQGEAGEPGASAGDLYVTVRVKPHPRFERQGDDILSTLTISFAQAALGHKATVKTLDGPVTIKIPPGTQSGEVFRIRDKGIPHINQWGRGDLLVKIVVEVPKKLSREQKKLIEELQGLD